MPAGYAGIQYQPHGGAQAEVVLHTGAALRTNFGDLLTQEKRFHLIADSARFSSRFKGARRQYERQPGSLQLNRETAPRRA